MRHARSCAAIARAGIGEGQATKAQQSPCLHRCTSRDHADEPGPARARPTPFTRRKAIAALRKREPSVEIEIRCCPALIGIPQGRDYGRLGQAGRQRAG